MARLDQRGPQQLRPVTIQRGFLDQPDGAVLVCCGKTRVLCTASIEVGVPEWRLLSGKGWVTAEYDMLPASTGKRKPRNRTKVDGRTQEIQRLIGRALRAVVDMGRMGPNSILIDCDVLQADGGTRTASITGAYVALVDAVRVGTKRGLWSDGVVTAAVAAVSVGVVAGDVLLDLDYAEDSAAETDCNLVMTDRGEWVEVQATGEQACFSTAQMNQLMDVGERGIRELFSRQREALESP